jgi:S1-C subfamily serine protease
MSNILVELSNAMASAVEKAGTSTVMVNARRRMPASGIAFAPDLVLTANHVVEREDDIKVRLHDGTQLVARIAGRDPGSDLAVVRLERAAAQPAETSETARIGQMVLALGRPSEEGIEASLGVISAVGGPVRTQRGSLEKFYRTDAVPYPGFSGGPLVDAEGKVAGMNTSGFGPGAFLTIPTETAFKIAAQLAEHGSVMRGYLGVRSQLVELPTNAQQALNRSQSVGLLIISVEKNSPAASGGLMVGDILVGLDGTPLLDHEALFSRLSGDVAGKTLPIEMIRGGQVQTLDVAIGAHA